MAIKGSRRITVERMGRAAAFACIMSGTACQPPAEVWANGVYDELFFSAPRSPYAAPGVIDFRVSRRVTTYDECGTFEFDECETTDHVTLSAATAQVSVLPEGIAEATVVGSGSGLRVQIEAIQVGEARLVVRADGYHDEYPFELATPADIRVDSEQGRWVDTALVLSGAEVELHLVMLDSQERELFSMLAPSAHIEDGPATLVPSVDTEITWLFQAESVGEGTLRAFHEPTAYSRTRPFRVVGDEDVAAVRLKRVGDYPWVDGYSLTCGVGESVAILVDLRDDAGQAIFGGGERLASSDSSVASVQSRPQRDCDFRIASDNVIVADCLKDDGIRLQCESPGAAEVSAAWGALDVVIDIVVL